MGMGAKATPEAAGQKPPRKRRRCCGTCMAVTVGLMACAAACAPNGTMSEADTAVWLGSICTNSSDCGRPLKVWVNGYIREHATKDLKPGEVLKVDEAWTQQTGWRFAFGMVKHILAFIDGPNELNILDARILMKESGLTYGQFFAKYGFVIIPHTTVMQPHEWEDEEKLRSVYDAEIRQVVAEQLEMADAIYGSTGTIMIRGPPLPNATREPKNFYAIGIHSDYPLDGEGYKQRCRLSDQKDQHDAIAADAYERTFARGDVEGYIRLNVWRPIRPMTAPLKHKPLAWLDPNTIHPNETILHAALGVATR